MLDASPATRTYSLKHFGDADPALLERIVAEAPFNGRFASLERSLSPAPPKPNIACHRHLQMEPRAPVFRNQIDGPDFAA